MRSVKLILRNLLLVAVALVLFESFSWARNEDSIMKQAGKYASKCKDKLDGKNCRMVINCTKQAESFAELDSKEKENFLTNQSAGAAFEEANKGEGGVKITDNSCGYSAITSKQSAVMVAAGNKATFMCKTACTAKPVPVKEGEEATDISQGEAEGALEELNENMCGQFKMYALKYEQGISSSMATCMAAKKAKGSLLTKVAIGAGVVGVGLLVKDHIDDKKDKKKKEKAEEEKQRAANGIIKDADGNDLMCFSEQNFLRTECSETMLGLCQGAKSTTAGCKAFNSNYCASTGSGSNYCLYSDSRTYCSQSGSLIASSPACTWSGSRSEECKKNPEQVSCLYDASADGLTVACANYPSDPLCAAHAAGRIVVQGGNAATTTAATTNPGATEPDYGDGASSVTMTDVINNGAARGVATSSDTNSPDTTTLASSDSMFTSSTSVATKACAAGLLQDCGN